MRYFAVCLMVLMLACLPWSAVAQQGDLEMTVTAEGSAAVVSNDLAKAEDEAKTDAKRNAVEQGVGVFVKSESLGKNYQVVEQTILTKSEGYIASWEPIDGSRKVENVDGNQLLTIKIKARVKLITLVNALSDVDAIYSAMQRPKVMVLVSEDNLGEQCKDLPASASAIMRVLQEKKFDIVDPEVVKRLVQKEANRVAIERGDAQAAAVLAMNEGAEILVLGSAKASEQKLPADAGDSIKAASALMTVRIVYSDTGDVLYTSKQINGRGVSTATVQEAGLKALDKAGSDLLKSDSQRFTSQVLARWASEVQNGRTYKLTVDNISYSELGLLKKVIGDFRGHVEFAGNSAYVGKTATINVTSKLTPEQFRDRLSSAKVAGKEVEITQVSGATTILSLKEAQPKAKKKTK